MALALGVAVAAIWVGDGLPLLGSAVSAILLGIAVRAIFGSPSYFKLGTAWAAKRLLKFAIILLGTSFSLAHLVQLGAGTFVGIVLVVLSALAVVMWLGRLMGLSGPLSSLIAVGTAICGASAIAAASPIIKADEDDTAYAISTIFAFNTLALVAYPLLGHLFNLSDAVYGAWVGMAIHDTSSVIAAGYAYSDDAGIFATVTKLARTTLVVPILLALALLSHRADVASRRAGEASQATSWVRLFPWFVVGFAVASLLRTFGVIPDAWAVSLTGVAKFLIVVALAGVGLGSDLTRLRRIGPRPFVLGLTASLLIAVLALAATLQLT